ncbi:hypothetical protein [Rhodococcus pyridinivorans]|uniref:hypothetical protein n=1 Tax=Rhodococcus pyridinivorans TaxID=103816 RepID=UPI0034201F45
MSIPAVAPQLNELLPGDIGRLDAELGSIGIDILSSHPLFDTAHPTRTCHDRTSAEQHRRRPCHTRDALWVQHRSGRAGHQGHVPTSAETFPPAHSSLELPASSIPSAEQVTEMFAAAFDYDLELDTRVRLFENASLDTPDPVQQVAHTGEATLRATTVVSDGAQALAVSVIGTGAPGGVAQAITVAPGNSAVVPLVAEHGIWKISRAWICTLVGPHCR